MAASGSRRQWRGDREDGMPPPRRWRTPTARQCASDGLRKGLQVPVAATTPESVSSIRPRETPDDRADTSV